MLVSASRQNNLYFEFSHAGDDRTERKVRDRGTPSPARETRALPRVYEHARDLFAQAFAELSARVLAIQFRDETGADLGGTNCFAFVGICAIAESFGIHHAYHFQNATFSFGMALRQKCKVRDFRGSE